MISPRQRPKPATALAAPTYAPLWHGMRVAPGKRFSASALLRLLLRQRRIAAFPYFWSSCRVWVSSLGVERCNGALGDRNPQARHDGLRISHAARVRSPRLANVGVEAQRTARSIHEQAPTRCALTTRMTQKARILRARGALGTARRHLRASLLAPTLLVSGQPPRGQRRKDCR